VRCRAVVRTCAPTVAVAATQGRAPGGRFLVAAITCGRARARHKRCAGAMDLLYGI
jgi:hypothetical protein